MQLLIQQKLLKFAGTSSALVRRAIAKYNKYPEKKKRHLAKLGLKTVFKLARVVFAAKGGAPDATVAEVLFEECQKRFGHNKLSAKAFKQFLASAHYHAGAHPKIALLCAFLGIGEKPFSSEVAGFYAEVLTALAESKVGMPIEYDERQERELVHFGRCSEVLREALEPGLPAEVVQDLRQRLAHLQERHAKALAQQVVDLGERFGKVHALRPIDGAQGFAGVQVVHAERALSAGGACLGEGRSGGDAAFRSQNAGRGREETSAFVVGHCVWARRCIGADTRHGGFLAYGAGGWFSAWRSMRLASPSCCSTTCRAFCQSMRSVRPCSAASLTSASQGLGCLR